MVRLHTDVYTLSPRVLVENFEDGALVLRLADHHVFELNPAAQFILAHTDGRRTIAEVAAALAETYAIPLEDALQDTFGLYAGLSTQNIVTLSLPGSANLVIVTEAL